MKRLTHQAHNLVTAGSTPAAATSEINMVSLSKYGLDVSLVEHIIPKLVESLEHGVGLKLNAPLILFFGPLVHEDTCNVKIIVSSEKPF